MCFQKSLTEYRKPTVYSGDIIWRAEVSWKEKEKTNWTPAFVSLLHDEIHVAGYINLLTLRWTVSTPAVRKNQKKKQHLSPQFNRLPGPEMEWTYTACFRDTCQNRPECTRWKQMAKMSRIHYAVLSHTVLKLCVTNSIWQEWCQVIKDSVSQSSLPLGI